MNKEELKQGYQPILPKNASVTPPNTGSNVRMKKDGYTWEDLDKAWWEGFENAKNKMEKQIAELEAQIEKMKLCANCKHCGVSGWCKKLNRYLLDKANQRCGNWEIKEE